MKERKIGDLVRALQAQLKDENAALEAELRQALENGEFIISFAGDTWTLDEQTNAWTR